MLRTISKLVTAWKTEVHKARMPISLNWLAANRAVNDRVGLFVRVPGRIGSSARQLTHRRSQPLCSRRPPCGR